ncbi:MAG: hypothetical protein FWF57_00840 [Defluviitaleaceae bacterium]|nr:hypothetical protein [Defluviitaleaceae bacterium]
MNNLFLLKKVNINIFFVVFSIGFLIGCSDIDFNNITSNEIVSIDETPDLDIVELGESIVTAMSFWEEWWDVRGRFGDEHLGEIFLDVPEYPRGIYQELFSTSGFESLQDIKDYLLQFYTETFLEFIFSLEPLPFIEYNNNWLCSNKVKYVII